MKKILTFLTLSGAFICSAQDIPIDTLKQGVSIDSLKEAIDDHSMRFGALDERLATMDSDLGKLIKIKISGYMQAQYEMYDFQDDVNKSIGSTTDAPITNSFHLRRARIKFTYEALDGIKFVLQPDFLFDKVSVKDAYVVLNDRWTQTYSLFVGQFNRLSYEVEFSSSAREFMERTRMTNTLYPNERDMGAKIEANFDTKYLFPLKLQLAVFNGNFGQGAIANQVRDNDSNKDVMARAVYSIKMPNKGLGIDVGAHGHFGTVTVLSQTTPTPTVYSDVNNNPFTPNVGDTLKRDWFGAEIQLFYDILGGMSLKGEYIAGTLSGTTNVAQTNSNFAGNRVREFNGLYASVIKNIGKSLQVSIRYDEFDPNTKLSGNDSGMTAPDLKYSTWSFGWQYFYDENVKIVLGYTMPTNEKSPYIPITNGANFQRDNRDNTFTIRLQAMF